MSTLREAIERLADEWDAAREPDGSTSFAPVLAMAYELRALLAEHPATPAEEVAEVAVGWGAGKPFAQADLGPYLAELRRVTVDLVRRSHEEAPLVDEWDGCICAYTHDTTSDADNEALKAGCERFQQGLRDHDAALTAKAKVEGRVEALREAADARPHWMSKTVSEWLHQRAEREPQ